MDIKLIVEDLQLSSGQTYRGTCPSCYGRGTFTASNIDGLLVWNCFKNSCNIKGRTATELTSADIRLKLSDTNVPISPTFVKPPYFVSLQNSFAYVGGKSATLWCNTWGLDTSKLLYDIKDRRVVFPIYDKGVLVDAAGRAISPKLTPKWLRYGTSKVPFMHGEGNVAILVEDCISASVVGNRDNACGVAILGTSLTEGHITALCNFSKVIVALDPDALKKTLAYTKELRTRITEVYALKLKDDLKYRLPEDMQKLDSIKWKKNS
tara:strand:- start:78 stop:872 length:795 start_codon:yes stop_codon:yes gene_type:complete